MNKKSMLIAAVVAVVVLVVLIIMLCFKIFGNTTRGKGEVSLDELQKEGIQTTEPVDENGNGGTVFYDSLLEGQLTEFNPENIPQNGNYNSSKDVELVARTDTEEEAKKAAELYRIELVEYSYGVALFKVTDGRTADEVIKQGKENNWLELAVNDTYYIN